MKQGQVVKLDKELLVKLRRLCFPGESYNNMLTRLYPAIAVASRHQARQVARSMAQPEPVGAKDE